MEGFPHGFSAEIYLCRMDFSYQLLFEKAPGLFLVLDPSLKIVAVSDAYLAATMTQRELIISRDLFDIFPDNPEDTSADGVSNLKTSLEKVMHSKTTDKMAIQKYDIRQPNGQYEERYWSPLNVPVLNSDGRVSLIIHSVEDVTSLIRSKQLEAHRKDENALLSDQNKKMSIEIYERIRQIDHANLELKKMNEILEEKTRLLELSNEDLAMFAETASHDIKAPFRSIGGHLEIISEKVKEYLNDDEIDQSIKSIRSARKRISTLLDDLLKFAKITRSGETQSQIDINKILKEVSENLEFNINEKKARINYPDNFPAIRGVRIQVFQLFQNLIANAIKFSAEDPVIDISFKQEKDDVEFAIKDNGIGIDSSYFERIFIPFVRLHGQEEYSGNGLGLAICRRIVESHGGRIWITSEKNAGTTFYFTLKKI